MWGEEKQIVKWDAKGRLGEVPGRYMIQETFERPAFYLLSPWQFVNNTHIFHQ
jgi:hypothetical protein